MGEEETKQHVIERGMNVSEKTLHEDRVWIGK
jgi:hypothetical protein